MGQYRPPEDFDQWEKWLAAGLHGRNRWRLSQVILGILFARGRRTVSSWWRAAGVLEEFPQFYYFLQSVGQRTRELAGRLLMILLTQIVTGHRALLAVDDSPTKRYGRHVQGAGIHHNPTPGPADQKFLYGHIWVTISLILRHPLWQTIGLPLIGLLYVRAQDVARIPREYKWRFKTKLQLAVTQLLIFAKILQNAGKVCWVVADGAYAKAPFLKPLIHSHITVVSRLRKDAALLTLPSRPKQRRRGQPRKYGTSRIDLRRRASHPKGWETIECQIYGKAVTKNIKTFLATYRPAGGVIRVVIVKEQQGPQYFFCTDPDATPVEIVEAFADRAAIEQDFHDVKEVWGAGQQQVRSIWSNIAVYNLNLWVQTLVECWAWHKPASELVDRSASPWDDPDRRPSHADRRKALCRKTIQREYLSLPHRHRKSSRIRHLYSLLLQLAT